MSRMPRKVDTNHGEIRDILRDMGYKVFDTHELGGGFPDLCVLTRTGVIILLEVKTPGGRLTDDERQFIQEWKNAPVFVVTSASEAIEKVRSADRW